MRINRKVIYEALLRLGCKSSDLRTQHDSIVVDSTAMSNLLGRKAGEGQFDYHAMSKIVGDYGWGDDHINSHFWVERNTIVVIRVKSPVDDVEQYFTVKDFILKKLSPELQPAWRRWIRRQWAEFVEAYGLPKMASR